MLNQAHPPAWAVFTDGSCWTKDRIGGWAWVAFTEGDDYETGSGSVTDTTISRMELTGPIEALMWIMERQGPSNVLVFSDSEYVVKGINDPSRARNQHLDLWGALCGLVVRHKYVKFEHIKGHHESFYNHEADRLAGQARKALQHEIQST